MMKFFDPSGKLIGGIKKVVLEPLENGTIKVILDGAEQKGTYTLAPHSSTWMAYLSHS